MEELEKQIQILRDNLINCPLPELRENMSLLEFYEEHCSFNEWATEMEAKIEELESQLRLIKLNTQES